MVEAQQDTVLLQGVVKDVRVGETYMGMEPMTRFISTTVSTSMGDVELCHVAEMVSEEQKDFVREGVEITASVEEVLSLVAEEDPEKVWVIGGGEIYRAMLPYCRLCYLTRVYARPESDVSFPDLDTLSQWQVLRSGAIVSDGTLDYQFIEYINRQV